MWSELPSDFSSTKCRIALKEESLQGESISFELQTNAPPFREMLKGTSGRKKVKLK